MSKYQEDLFNNEILLNNDEIKEDFNLTPYDKNNNISIYQYLSENENDIVISDEFYKQNKNHHNFAHTHSATHSPTHSPTDSAMHAPTDSAMHAPMHAPTYSAMHVPTHAPTYSAMHAPTHAPMHAVKLPKKNLFIWLYILLAILILAIVMYFLIEKNLIKLPTF